MMKPEEAIGEKLKKSNQSLAVAESCTGGLVAKLITDVPGSSEYFELGMVTYSNIAKETLLGVPAAVFKHVGAVSKDCAIAMAVGLARKTGADWTLATTGIAGPGGGSVDKPVGLVHIAVAGPGGIIHEEKHYGDIGREKVREAAADDVLKLLLSAISAS